MQVRRVRHGRGRPEDVAALVPVPLRRLRRLRRPRRPRSGRGRGRWQPRPDGKVVEEQVAPVLVADARGPEVALLRVQVELAQHAQARPTEPQVEGRVLNRVALEHLAEVLVLQVHLVRLAEGERGEGERGLRADRGQLVRPHRHLRARLVRARREPGPEHHARREAAAGCHTSLLRPCLALPGHSQLGIVRAARDPYTTDQGSTPFCLQSVRPHDPSERRDLFLPLCRLQPRAQRCLAAARASSGAAWRRTRPAMRPRTWSSCRGKCRMPWSRCARAPLRRASPRPSGARARATHNLGPPPAQNCDMNEEMRTDCVDLVITAIERYANNYEVRALPKPPPPFPGRHASSSLGEWARPENGRSRVALAARRAVGGAPREGDDGQEVQRVMGGDHRAGLRLRGHA